MSNILSTAINLAIQYENFDLDLKKYEGCMFIE